VTWTLHWEWRFYLCLPLLAVFARRKGMHLQFVVVAILACQAYLHLYPNAAHKDNVGFWMLFLLGMLAGSLKHEGKLLRIPDWVGSSLLVVLMVLVFQFKSPSMTTLSQLMLGAILYLIISGTSVFGLLKTRPAIRLGDVSYGIYLLQGLALGFIFRPHFSRVRDLGSPLNHWVLCLVCALFLICVATVTHVWIERPGILAGRWVGNALKARVKQYPRLHWLG
jgi:peptidoglycan/LPS O-acetylase OafA/YrhL